MLTEPWGLGQMIFTTVPNMCCSMTACTEVGSIPAGKPLIYELPPDFIEGLPTALVGCVVSSDVLFIKSTEPGQLALKCSFLFPSGECSSVFLLCWLFLVAVMPFLAEFDLFAPNVPRSKSASALGETLVRPDSADWLAKGKECLRGRSASTVAFLLLCSGEF